MAYSAQNTPCGNVRKRPHVVAPPPKSLLIDKDKAAFAPQNWPKKDALPQPQTGSVIRSRRCLFLQNSACGGCAFTPLPGHHQEYGRFNIDLSTDHYIPTSRSYSAPQRGGITEPSPPLNLTREIYTMRYTRPSRFRGILLHRLAYLQPLNSIAVIRWGPFGYFSESRQLNVETKRIGRTALSPVSNGYGGIDPYLSIGTHKAYYAREWANWVAKFAAVFPIAGNLGQEPVFPPNGDADEWCTSPELLRASKLRVSGRGRRVQILAHRVIFGDGASTKSVRDIWGPRAAK